MKDHSKNIPLFKWFYDIYFKRSFDQNGKIIENKWTYKIHWKRVQGSGIIILNSIFGVYFYFMAYKWAIMAGLNTGVLMSLYSIKPIFTSILFYIVFRQTLKWFEVIGVALWVAWALLIGLSSDHISINSKGETSRTYILWAWGSLLISLLLISLRTTAVKYYFGDAKEVNISTGFNVNVLFVNIGFFRFTLLF